MKNDQLSKALEYHIKKEKECHPNTPNLHKHHLKRIGELTDKLAKV